MDMKIRQLVPHGDNRNYLAVMEDGEVRWARVAFIKDKERLLLGTKLEVYLPAIQFPYPAPGQRWVFQTKDCDATWATLKSAFEIEVGRVEPTLVVDTDGAVWSLDCFTEDGIGFVRGYGMRRERFLVLGQ